MKRNHPEVAELLKRTIKVNDCLEWSGKRTPRGYGRLNINTVETYAHRAVIVAKTGMPIPTGMCVLHSCDNPSCINPDHLRIGTHKENSQDMVSRNRVSRPNSVLWSGSNNPKSVLTDEQKNELIELMRSGMSASEAADIFPVSPTRCAQIRKAAGIVQKRKRRWFKKPPAA